MAIEPFNIAITKFPHLKLSYSKGGLANFKLPHSKGANLELSRHIYGIDCLKLFHKEREICYLFKYVSAEYITI